MAASLMRMLLIGGALSPVLPTYALEVLPDPTRPAGEIYTAGTRAADAKAEKQTSPNTVLQSTIISPQHRAAVINGETVALGGRVGDATLVEVHESSVVLQGKQGRRVLELYPGILLHKEAGSVQKKDNPAAPANGDTHNKPAINAEASGAGSPGQNKDEK